MDYPFTITAHMNLYCDHKYVRDSIISSQFVGSVTGLILLSILADKFGRKIIIVSTLYLTFMGAISNIFVYDSINIGCIDKITSITLYWSIIVRIWWLFTFNGFIFLFI